MSYKQLGILYQRYHTQGLEILGFPSNDFRQERGSNAEINAFVHEHYPEATFPLFEKTSVNGPDEHPVYTYLKRHVPGNVPHNFYKYVVGRDGTPIRRYGKKEEPLSFEQDIIKLLGNEN